MRAPDSSRPACHLRTTQYSEPEMSTVESVHRRGRPITRNRVHILETAMNAYWHDDTAAISVNAICVLARVSKPSLYREFGSEDGLTAAVLKHYAEEVLGPLEELLVSPFSFAAKLEGVLVSVGEDPRLESGCLFVKMRSSRSRLGPQTHTCIAAIETHTLGCFTEFFAQAAATGEWDGGVAPELAARYLHEQLGLASSQRASGMSTESVRELLDLAMSVLR